MNFFLRTRVVFLLILFSSYSRISLALNPFTSFSKATFSIGRFIIKRPGLTSIGIVTVLGTYMYLNMKKYQTRLQEAQRRINEIELNATREKSSLLAQIKDLQSQNLKPKISQERLNHQSEQEELLAILLQQQEDKNTEIAKLRKNQSNQTFSEAGRARLLELEKEIKQIQEKIAESKRAQECCICTQEPNGEKPCDPCGYYFECMCKMSICRTCALSKEAPIAICPGCNSPVALKRHMWQQPI